LTPALNVSISNPADAQPVLPVLPVQADRVRRHHVLRAAQEVIADHLAACVPSLGYAPGDLGARQVPGR